MRIEDGAQFWAPMEANETSDVLCCVATFRGDPANLRLSVARGSTKVPFALRCSNIGPHRKKIL